MGTRIPFKNYCTANPQGIARYVRVHWLLASLRMFYEMIVVGHQF